MSLCLRLLGLKAPTEPGLLCKVVVNTLARHANRMDWAMAVYRGKLAKYNKFVREQKVPGT